MEQRTNRREFLKAAAAGCVAVIPADRDPRPQTLDLHMHVFGLGDGGSGCRLSEQLQRGRLFQALKRGLRLQERAETVDASYVLALAEHLEGSEIGKGVILSQDAIYDDRGQPDWDRTPVYVPNDYLFRVVARYPATMIPCVSINPQRADRMEELNRCIERGARILKIHPPIQGVDPSDRKYLPFFRRCAEAKVVVMVHTGHEHSAPIVRSDYANPRRLVRVLEEGCTVVACHAGTGQPGDEGDMLPDFLAMIRRHKNLWGDTAVLGTPGRVRDVGRLLEDDLALTRLLHGSDFPIPSAPLAFAGRIGFTKAARLQAIGSFVQQDLALKRALGFGQQSAARAWRLICGEPEEP